VSLNSDSDIETVPGAAELAPDAPPVLVSRFSPQPPAASATPSANAGTATERNFT
jgi:hypothetical protein